ncbi:MAG TPA: hypothetical protein ENJ20_07180 [Bacteroidetes bacterium]|nr:hypothetical protein [Bacteroidota bacterium]
MVYFTDSDLHFSGNGYDFTLKNVVAKDRQSKFSIGTYFGPTKFTIPQTNYGIGYFFKNNYILTLGLDHMKYVVQRPQEVAIFGKIDGSGLPYQGIYNGEKITIDDSLLKLEHTNGLNYLSVGILRADNLLKKIKSLGGKMELILREGVGAGVLIPKTDITLLSQPRNDQYRISGFGISANTGVEVLLFNHFFIRAVLKAGYINLVSFNASPKSSGKGSQQFFFLQPGGQFGWAFYIGR